MEVKKPALLIIYTIILVVAMVGLIVTLSRHPMGADFSTFITIPAGKIDTIKNMSGARIVIRGKAVIDDPKKLFTIEKEGNIIGFIRKKSRIDIGQPEKEVYEDFKTSEFSLMSGKEKISVIGQPEMVMDKKGRITCSSRPEIFWDVIRQDKEYSIFGTALTQDQKPAIQPYLVTSAPIEEITEAAQAHNKRLGLIQYASIFAFTIVYMIALWLSKVFGPETESDSEEETKN